MGAYADENFKEFKRRKEKTLRYQKQREKQRKRLQFPQKEVLYPGTVVIRYNQNRNVSETKYIKVQDYGNRQK